MGELIGLDEVMVEFSGPTHLFDEWLDCGDDGSHKVKVHHVGNHKWRKLEYETLRMRIDFHQIIRDS